MDKLAIIQSQETIEELKKINQHTLELVNNFNLLLKTSKEISGGLLKGLPKDYVASEKALIQVEKERVKLLKEIAVTEERIARIENRKKKDADIGAFKQLAQTTLQAKNRAKDLGAEMVLLEQKYKSGEISSRKYNAELNRLSREYTEATLKANGLHSSVVKINKDMGDHRDNVGNYAKSINSVALGFRNLLAAFGVASAIDMFADVMRSSYGAVKSLDAMNIALKQVFETEQEYIIQKQFLSGVTEKFGLDLLKTTESYTKFSAAVKGSSLEGEEARRIFESFAGASSKLGLNIEQQEGIFRALEQMISKGTVQAEELRGQLGDRMPGAFRLFANAMGVSTKELNKMLKDGEVLSNDVLPKVADKLAEMYDLTSKTDTLTAAQNRFTREWALFLEELSSNEDVVNGIKDALEGLSYFLGVMVDLIIDKGEDSNTILTNLYGTVETLAEALFDLATNLGMVDQKQKDTLFSSIQLKNDLVAIRSMAEVTSAAIRYLSEVIGGIFKLGSGRDEFMNYITEIENRFLNSINEYKKIREGLTSANSRGVVYSDEISQTKAYEKAWNDARKAKSEYFAFEDKWFSTKTGRNTRKSVNDFDEELNPRVKTNTTTETDEKANKKLEAELKKTQRLREKAQREKESADRKAYNAQKKLLDDEIKLIEQNLENKLKLAKEDPYLTNVEKITEQVSIYSQLINANENYYDKLIAAAKKYNQDFQSLQNQKLLKTNTLSDASSNVMLGMPNAIKDDLEYQRQLEDLIIAAGNAEDRRRIIANSTLSIKQKERMLELNSLQDEKELLELNRERLVQDVDRLTPLYLSGKLTREQRTEWEKTNKELEETNEKLQKNKEIIESTKVKNLREGLQPLINMISGDLGVDSSTMTNALDTILNKEMSLVDKYVASVQLAGEFLTNFFKTQADTRIAELDRQLQYSKEATEAELKFVEDRYNALNAMSELTEEQETERRALEDEARVIREQQRIQEKTIEAEKLKAQQQAMANQAIMNGLLAATKTLAETGATPLGWGLAAAAAAYGVAQAVSIMSKNPVPQYFMGRDGGNAEWAITQDRYGAEAISDKHGNIKTWGTNSGAKLTWLDEGDKVHTAAETKQLMLRMANKGIPNVNILTKEKEVDYDRLADKVGDRFERVFRKFDKVSFVEDERGNVFMQEGGKIPVYKGKKRSQIIKVNIKNNDRS